jgi:hypothetical protein
VEWVDFGVGELGFAILRKSSLYFGMHFVIFKMGLLNIAYFVFSIVIDNMEV